jgi:hypothetical protein
MYNKSRDQSTKAKKYLGRLSGRAIEEIFVEQ